MAKKAFKIYPKTNGIDDLAAANKITLHDFAFNNSFHANIISTVSNGKIIAVNRAACELLDYTNKELLTKSYAAIFDINESSFKKMMRQRTAEGQAEAEVTVIKKSGEPMPCQITSDEIRKLTKWLTTDLIERRGLCEAVDNIIMDTMEANSLKISCSMETFIEDNVNAKFKLNVFRIVQEQLNNILKHAKATEVTINLPQNKKLILLSISDNGIGSDKGKQQKSTIVANIKSRTQYYKGAADFVSLPGQGSALNVTFPVTSSLLSK